MQNRDTLQVIPKRVVRIPKKWRKAHVYIKLCQLSEKPSNYHVVDFSVNFLCLQVSEIPNFIDMWFSIMPGFEDGGDAYKKLEKVSA